MELQILGPLNSIDVNLQSYSICFATRMVTWKASNVERVNICLRKSIVGTARAELLNDEKKCYLQNRTKTNVHLLGSKRRPYKSQWGKGQSLCTKNSSSNDNHKTEVTLTQWRYCCKNLLCFDLYLLLY